MKKITQAKLALQLQKVQRELKNKTLEIEGGDGAVVVEITGQQKIKKIHIDPDRVDLEQIGDLEDWLESALKEAIRLSQEFAADKMRPFVGQLGKLGL